MFKKHIFILSWILLIFPFGEALGGDTAPPKTQPNASEPAVDISVYMRPALPPEEAPDDTGLGPSLVSKLGGFANSLRDGKLGEWIADNPPRLTAVSAAPLHAGGTPRYSLVVLLSFGAGGETRHQAPRLAAARLPDVSPYPEDKGKEEGKGIEGPGA